MNPVNRVVMDASAILALALGEPGSEIVASFLIGSIISAVNYAEVITRLVDAGAPYTGAVDYIGGLQIEVVPLEIDQAAEAARLRPETKRLGLSLGDRCCLALGRIYGLPVVTADRKWASLSVGVTIQTIR